VNIDKKVRGYSTCSERVYRLDIKRGHSSLKRQYFQLRMECPLTLFTWGRIGFDGIVEVSAAGRGFSLASLKNGKLKINANEDNLVPVAA
jgi:hypothetical protein